MRNDRKLRRRRRGRRRSASPSILSDELLLWRSVVPNCSSLRSLDIDKEKYSIGSYIGNHWQILIRIIGVLNPSRQCSAHFLVPVQCTNTKWRVYILLWKYLRAIPGFIRVRCSKNRNYLFREELVFNIRKIFKLPIRNYPILLILFDHDVFTNRGGRSKLPPSM